MVDTKNCIRCKKSKPKTSEYFFYRNKKKGWLSSWCKDCRKAHRKDYRESENKTQRDRRGLVKCRECGTSDKPKRTQLCDPCKKSLKKARKKYDKAIYKSRLRKAMPLWADRDKLREIYKNRPDGFHVDHIIPIRGEFVSGLHVPENLQYLPASINMAKSNHYSILYRGRW